MSTLDDLQRQLRQGGLTVTAAAALTTYLASVGVNDPEQFLKKFNNLSDVASPSQSRINLGLDAYSLAPAVDTSGGGGSYDPLGAAAAAQSVSQPLDTDLTAIAALSTTSYGRALLTLADAPALRAYAAVDTSALQPLDSDLTAIAALSTTSFGRSLLTMANASALQSAAGLTPSVFDVKKYGGAVGNDTADDTTAIQNCINAAAAAGGGVVYLPIGTYKTTSTLTVVSNNVEIRGEGKNSVIHYTGSSVALRQGQKTPALTLTGLGIRDFRINGTSTGTIGLQAIGVQFSYYSDLRAENFTGTGAIGVCFDTQSTGSFISTNNNSWRGGYLANNYHGFKITKDPADTGTDGSNHNQFFGLRVASFSGIGVDVDAGENNSFYGLDASTINNGAVGVRINDDVNAFYSVRTDNSFGVGNTATGIRITATGKDFVIVNPTGNGPTTRILKDDDTTTGIILRHPFTRIKGLAEIDSVQMDNVAFVPATPTTGGVLYTQANVLKFKDNAGTITSVAPGGGGGGTTANVIPVFNVVMDYGATGDGSTDDTTAVQNAINAAATAGGLVWFPPGTYSLNNITLKANITYSGIYGQSVLQIRTGAPFLATADSGSSTAFITQMSFTNLTFRGRIDTDTTFDEHRHLLNLNGVRDVLIDHNQFIGWHGDAVYLGSGNSGPPQERHNQNVKITHNFFDGLTKNNRDCVSIIDGDDILVEGNRSKRHTRNDMPGFVDVEPNAGSGSYAVCRNIKVIGNHSEDHNQNFFQINLPEAYTTNPTNFIVAYNTDDAGVGNSTTRFMFLDYNRGTITDSSPDQNIKVFGNEARTAYTWAEVNRGIVGLEIINNTFADMAGCGLLGWGGPIRQTTIRGNKFWRIGANDGNVTRLSNAYGTSFEDNHFHDCGGNTLLNFSLGNVSSTSDNTDWINNKVTGTCSSLVVKNAGHTITNTANNRRRLYRENGISTTSLTTNFATAV